MTRRRALIFAVIAAVVALDAALWLRLFSPDQVADGASAASSEQSAAARSTTTESANEQASTNDDPGAGESTSNPASDGAAEPDPTGHIRLGSYTETVGLLETATLSGRYHDAPRQTTLYLQRLSSDGWLSFPLPTVVTPAGRFRAHVELGQPGPNRLRIVDPATQTRSEVVTITVR
jgi:hypothetical protein